MRLHDNASVTARYPQEWEADVVMASGRPLHVRPIEPGDAPRLQAFHARLSDQSVYYRYFGPKPTLSAEELVRLTTVDYRTRMAFVGLLRGEIVGVARYEGIDETTAEVAFVVRDDLQGRGIGSILLEHLAAAARERGITRFVAETLPMNQRMIATFRESGFDVDARRTEDVVDVSFRIDPTQASRAVQAAREQRAEARSVERLLSPSRIAIVGVSRLRESVGHQLLLNLDASGFAGEVIVVHPEAERIAGHPCVRSLADVSGVIDLVLVAVAAPDVDAVVAQATAKGAIGLVVVSGGFGDTGVDGLARQDDLVSRCRAAGIRLVGPNALGVITTTPPMNASLARRMPAAGDVAVFAQSGALSMSILDRIEQAGLGVSSFVSAGNRADVSGNDLLQFWESDPSTAVVMLYLESIGNGRKFIRLLRRMTMSKPVLMVRTGGRGTLLPTGHAALSTHLPTQAVSQVLDAAGLIVLNRVDDMIDAAGVLSGRRRPEGRRVAIIGNSDAVAVLARNAAEREGLDVAVVVTFARDCAPGRYATELAAVAAGVDSALLVYVPAIEQADDETLLSELADLARASTPCVVRVIPAGLGVREPGVFDDVERAVGALAAVCPPHERGGGADDDVMPSTVTEAEEDAAPREDLNGIEQVDARMLLQRSGLAIQPDDPDPHAPGLEVVITDDPLFGPVLRVGLDTDLARLLDAAVYRLAPLVDVEEARHALAAVPGLALAEGVHEFAPTLVRLSRLAAGDRPAARLIVRGLRWVDGRVCCTEASVEWGMATPVDPPARRM